MDRLITAYTAFELNPPRRIYREFFNARYGIPFRLEGDYRHAGARTFRECFYKKRNWIHVRENGSSSSSSLLSYTYIIAIPLYWQKRCLPHRKTYARYYSFLPSASSLHLRHFIRVRIIILFASSFTGASIILQRDHACPSLDPISRSSLLFLSIPPDFVYPPLV